MAKNPTPHEGARHVNVRTLQQAKEKKQKISILTAYDYWMAKWLDEAGVDCILVGDSLGMVVQGKPTTLSVTVNQMIYHGRIVVSATSRAMVIVDLPFPVGQLGIRHTVRTAARIMKRTGCTAVKMEGGAAQADSIAALVDAGIPTMAHIGLRPQSVHALGGFRIQRDKDQLYNDAIAAQEAGAFAVLIECVPSKFAAAITRDLHVPTIGIGAGKECDGQVLVTHDMLGFTNRPIGKFVRKYADVNQAAVAAVRQYCQDVSSGTFPADGESFE
jgi:3-methyl-2-oxobutanoate hydroxymethyltransferase